jgi:hypothetical protein
MSDIQRYTTREVAQWTKSDPDAEWVPVAALAQARAEGRRQEWVNQNDEIQANRDEGYEQGVIAGVTEHAKGNAQRERDVLEAAVQRVEALPEMNAPMIGRVVTKRHVIAAIKDDGDE